LIIDLSEVHYNHLLMYYSVTWYLWRLRTASEAVLFTPNMDSLYSPGSYFNISLNHQNSYHSLILIWHF